MSTGNNRDIELSKSANMDSEQLAKSIDQEIVELEELINLQRRKVELLRKKNAMETKGSNSSKLNEASNVSSSASFSPMQQTATSNFSAETGANSPSSKFGTSNSSKQLSLLSSMQRFNRLATDLANERTLMAWCRTAMAAARTALAFLGLVGITKFGDGLVYTTSIGFAVVALWMMIQGGVRYKKIKEILLLPEPPVHYGRFSNAPVNLLLTALIVLLIIGNSADQWSK